MDSGDGLRPRDSMRLTLNVKLDRQPRPAGPRSSVSSPSPVSRGWKESTEPWQLLEEVHPPSQHPENLAKPPEQPIFPSDSSLDNTVRNTESLRRHLLRSQEPWKQLEALTFRWAVCAMELLQAEYDLFMDDSLPGSEFGIRYGRKCIKCLQKLSKKHGILPPSYVRHDIAPEGSHAVCGGTYSDIWKGRMNQKPVSLKVLRLFAHAHAPEHDRIVKEFCHEALVWKLLRHPNVLPFLGVNTELFSPSYCLISPWMANSNIMVYLEKNPQHDRLKSITEIAQGLQYLHEYDPPIVHRDIKGFNILVSDDLRCCLADFGLSGLIQSQISSSVGQQGTFRWMAPEIFAPDAFPACEPEARDIYALGCTILEIYTGKPPFHEEKHDPGVMHKVFSGERPRRPSTNILPDKVWNVTQLCWQHLPTSRPKAYEVTSLLTSAQQDPSSESPGQE